MEVLADGVYHICPHCEKYSKCKVEEGLYKVFVFCGCCNHFIGSMGKREKKLYYWHVYHRGNVLPEEESPYP